MKRISFLCHVKSLCAQYSIARQQCAVAGNFDNCVSVKMGNDLQSVGMCTNEGGLLNSPTDLPSAMQCLFSVAGEYLP